MNSLADKPSLIGFKAGWQIFRHELLFVTWALMEVALITPLFLALTPWTTFWSPAMTAIWLLLIMLIPFNLSRLTSVLRISVQRQQIIMVVALFITLLVAWRIVLYSPTGLLSAAWLLDILAHFGDSTDPRWSRELALFVTISLMWWRGISLAGRGVDYRDVGFRMRVEILLAVFLVAGLAGSLLTWSVTPFVLLFLFASLLSVVLTRVEQLELSRSGRSFPIGPSWLLIVVAVAAAVVFTTGVISGMVGNESVGAVVGWFEPLWVALRFAIAPIVSILGLLISPLLIVLIVFVEWLVGLFGPAIGAGLEGFHLMLQSLPQADPEEVVESTETIGRDYRQLLTGLSMIFVILLTGLALGRLFRMARPPAELQREAVTPFEGLGRPGRLGLGRRLLDRLNVLRRWQAAASIRHAYRDMCTAAAQKGYPRAESETPYEYLKTLAKAWPENSQDTALITEAYNRAHYGELPENEAELQPILDAWKRLSAVDSAPETG